MVGIAAHMPSMPLRRKKWTEEEEETLISKYGELLQSGFLSKMKSRERKFEPIAAHVNALFHAQNSVAYLWQWTWKDASTKVQNMRHQYLGVKQKIRKTVVTSIDASEHEDFKWEDGLSHWSNFLKYKEVFGDQELDVSNFFTHPSPNPRLLPHRHHRPCPHPAPQQQHHPTHPPTTSFQPAGGSIVHSLSKDFIDNDVENGGLLLGSVKDSAASVVDHVVLDGEPGDLATGLGFEYDGDGDEHGMKDGGDDYEDDDDDPMEYSRRKRRRQWGRPGTGLESYPSDSQILAFIEVQFAEFREREARREERDMEREKEWVKRQVFMEAERMKQRQEWETERREMEEMRLREAERRDAELQEQQLKRDLMEQQRREIERERDTARDEKMEREKMDWREKMETQAMQHQATMMQIQLQISQCQQHSIAMLSGALLQMAGQGNDLSGQGSFAGPFLSQLLQNLQTHGNGMVQCGIRRGAGESSDSQFDVDG